MIEPNMKKAEKKYQVWIDYGSEGWSLKEFDTFTECVDFIAESSYTGEKKITKTVVDEHYTTKPL